MIGYYIFYMTKQRQNQWTIKDKLEIAEAIFTIVVSMMAIWGTIVAWENGFWHKLERVTDKLHQEFVLKNKEKTMDADIFNLIDDIVD